MSSINCDDWKLIYLMKQHKLELYNLKEDINETKDLAGQNPEKVKELAKALSDCLRWKETMPYLITGKPSPMPDEL